MHMSSRGLKYPSFAGCSVSSIQRVVPPLLEWLSKLALALEDEQTQSNDCNVLLTLCTEAILGRKSVPKAKLKRKTNSTE